MWGVLFRVLVALTAVVGPLLPGFLDRAIVVYDRGAFSKFCRGRGALVGVWPRSGDTSAAGCVGPEFCGDWVCRSGGIVGKSGFSGQFAGAC